MSARNALRRQLGLSGVLDYDSIRRSLSAFDPYAGMVYFHLLLDRLADRGLLS